MPGLEKVHRMENRRQSGRLFHAAARSDLDLRCLVAVVLACVFPTVNSAQQPEQVPEWKAAPGPMLPT